MTFAKRKSSPKWWKSIGFKDWVSIGASIVTAAAAVFAGAKYVFGAFTPISLEIALPPLIEFRCSTTSFEAAACTQATRPDDYHVTITSALFLRAIGDPTKEATITEATATIAGLGMPKIQPKLTWIWSADFVPGQKFERKQVTANSIKGGETRSQEMWFFPLDESCGTATLEKCTGGRRNFIPWLTFVSRVATTSRTVPRAEASFDITFSFKFREGDAKDKDKSITCTVEISETLQNMANTADKPQHEVLYLSAPCRLKKASA